MNNTPPPPYSSVCSSPSSVGKVSSNVSVGSPNFSGGSPQLPTGSVSSPILSIPPVYGPNPVHMECPNCGSRIYTNILTKPGALTWLVCLGFFAIGWLCIFVTWYFCWIPFCVDDCMDVIHSCPSCGTNLGKYSRI